MDETIEEIHAEALRALSHPDLSRPFDPRIMEEWDTGRFYILLEGHGKKGNLHTNISDLRLTLDMLEGMANRVRIEIADVLLT